jgi:PAS domain S-box-containing protein
VVRGATQVSLQNVGEHAARLLSVIVMDQSDGQLGLDRFGTHDRIEVTGVLWRRDDHRIPGARYVLFPRSAAEVAGLGLTARRRTYLLLALVPLLPMIALVLARMQAGRSARHLRVMEARFHALYHEALDAVFVQDGAWRIHDANHAAASLTGLPVEALRERTLLDFFVEDDRTPLAESVAELHARGHLERDARLRQQDGRIADVTLRLTIIPLAHEQRVLTVIRDVTARRHLEEQLRQAQKMEAVGQLAGGVAHDFNNSLTVIGMHCEFLAEHLERDEAALQDVRAIRDAATRSAGLTRQLLAFSRKQILQPHLLDANAAIMEIERMLRRLIGEDITLTLDLESGLGCVLADPGQMAQVLMNLAVNARDAMADGGRLSIVTRRVDRADFTSDDELAPGAYAMLAVSDTGCGMSADVRARAFEPFFTTKPQGKGTGLGLATTYGIVRQSGGHVTLESALGEGTTFRIYMPLQTGAAEQSQPAEDEDPTTGSETVLLVEDEENVRALARRVLEREGYAVLSAANGTEAIRLAEGHRGTIDVLVTDIVMPGLNGRELHALLDATLGGVRVLFMSGYTDDDFIRRGLLRHDLPFLEKPFTAEQFAARVRMVLDAEQWEASAD